MKVEVAKLPSKVSKQSNRELWAKVCYHYGAYDLEKASRLPARDVALLLKIAKKEEALKMYDLTQIAAAPHTEKGRGVKNLSKYFEKEAK